MLITLFAIKIMFKKKISRNNFSNALGFLDLSVKVWHVNHNN